MARRARPASAANNVRTIREDLAWPKAELARKAVIALGTLDRMEDGLPTRKYCRTRVARALGKPFQTVFPNDRD